MTDLQEMIIRCSVCCRKKTPDCFNINQKTNTRYKSCIECGIWNAWRHTQKVKDKQCPHCSYATHAPSTLNRHIKTVHDKVKEYECNICNKTFGYKKDMERHIKIVHNKVKEFECDICGKAFGYTRKIWKDIVKQFITR